MYFVLPTEENITKIAQDCAGRLYDSFYLNFASSIPKSLMESLALKTLQTDSSSRITKVFDQYVNFVSLESNLFSLNLRSSYAQLNALNDQIVMGIIDKVVEGLLALCVTMVTRSYFPSCLLAV